MDLINVKKIYIRNTRLVGLYISRKKDQFVSRYTR